MAFSPTDAPAYLLLFLCVIYTFTIYLTTQSSLCFPSKKKKKQLSVYLLIN